MSDKSLIERIISEGGIGCGEAGRVFGSFRDGKPIHKTTVSRMCLNGVRLPDGRLVRLEHFKSSGKIVTSRPAILRFLEAQQLAAADDFPTPTPAARRRSAESAYAELEAAGA